MSHVVHTMGLGDRALETVLEDLERAGTRVVVDVRRYPSAARHPHHRAEVLHRELAARGYEVRDLGALLGGDRRGGYERYMRTGAFRRGMGKLEDLARSGPVMLVCAERDPERCHRRFLAAALEARGWRVAHRGLTLSERAARRDLRLVRKTG